MCGLFGWFSSSIAQQDIEKFNLLMFLSTTRGKDSTGVMSVIRHGQWKQEKDVRYHFLKSPIPAWDFQRLSDYNTLVRLNDIKGLMGHARAATIGSVNSDNAHPFESPNGQIIGAHNGTLTGEYPFKEKDKTDSEAIMAIIEKDGLKGLAKVTGAWALTFLDTVNNTFNLIRNRDRPLFYFQTSYGDFAYASEKWMLRALQDKYNLAGEIKDLEPYKLLSFDLMEERYLMDGMSITDVEGLEAPKAHVYNSRFQGWRGAYGYTDFDSETDELPLVWQNPRNYLLDTSPSGPHSRVEKASNGVSVAAVGNLGGGKLIEEAQQKREKEAQVPQKEKESTAGVKTSNVVGFSRDPKGKFTSSTKEQGGTGSQTNDNRSLVVHTSPRLRDGNLPFLRNLKEKQRMTGTGAVEVETLKGNWVPMEDFLLMLEYGACKWTNESSEVEDTRYWLNKSEWISETAWEDPEIKHMYGNDPAILNSFLN